MAVTHFFQDSGLVSGPIWRMKYISVAETSSHKLNTSKGNDVVTEGFNADKLHLH